MAAGQRNAVELATPKKAQPPTAKTVAPAAPRKRPRWIRRSLWTLVLLLTAGAGASWYIARPAHLRALLEDGLHNANLELVDLGDIAYTPWGGIEFTDLEVALRGEDAPAPPSRVRPHSRVRFGYARVTCNNWALLRGKFRPHQAHVRELICSIVRDPTGPDWEWPETTAAERAEFPALVDFLPQLEIDQADVQLAVLDGDRPRLIRRWQFAANGSRTTNDSRERVYTLTLRPTGGAAAAGTQTGRDAPSLMELRVFQNRIEGAVDWLESTALIPMLPGRAAEALREIDFRGSAKLDRIVIRDQRVEEMSLQISHVTGSVPFEEDLPPMARFLQITGGEVNAVLARDPGRAPLVSVDMTARINGSPARLALRTSPVTAAAPPAPAGDGIPHDQRPTIAERVLDAVLGDAARYRVDFSVDKLRGPIPEEQPALFASKRLHPEARDFFVNFRPVGCGNIGVSLAGVLRNTDGRIEVDKPERVEATCEPVDVRIRYYRFPYDITDVRGRFRTGLDGTFLEGLSGRHGDALIRCDGYVQNWYEWAPFALLFHATGVPLNHELYDALPPKDQRRWDEQWPMGVCDIDVVVDRVGGAPDLPQQPVNVGVDARMLSGSLLTPDGRRLEQAEGTLLIREGTLRIADLHAFLDGAPVRLRGEMRTAVDGRVDTQMQIEAAGLPIERTHRVGFGDTEREVRFSGVADVWGRICGKLPGADPRDHFALRLRDGRLFDAGPDMPWNAAGGTATLHNNVLRLTDFSAQRDQAQFNAAGVLPQSPDSTERMQLELGVRAPALERVLDSLAPPDWSNAVRQLRITGEGRVALRLKPEAPGPIGTDGTDGGASAAALQLSIEAAQARPEWLPLPLRNVRAVALVSASGFDLQSTTADLAGGGRLAVHGVGRWHGTERGAELNLRADDINLTPEVVSAMPPRLAKFLTRIAPSGKAALLLDRLDWRETPAGDTWRIEGRIGLENAAMRLGLGLTECTGEIVGTAMLKPSGDFEPAATFSVERGRLAGRSVTDWEGQITRSADGRWLKFVDLRGKLCQGTAVANVQVDLETSEYELNVVMRDVDLDSFMQRTTPEPEHVRSATLDGHVFLRGAAGEDSTRRGQGEMTIVNASFVKLPVLASVAQASREHDPTIGDTVSEMKLRYNWEGNVLRFDRVSVESADLRLVGTGWWDTQSDRIDLTLVGAHPRDWPRVAVLSQILEFAGQRLVRYRVEGRVDAPRVTIEPLAELTEPIRALLRE